MNPLVVILDDLFNLIVQQGLAASHLLQSGAMSILAAALAIRLIKLWLESALDGGQVIGESINVIILTLLASMAIQNIDAISSIMWSTANDLVSVFSTNQGPQQTGVSGMSSVIWSEGVCTVKNIWAFTMAPQGGGGSFSLFNVGNAIAGGLVMLVNVILASMVSLLFMAYYGIIMLQLFVGVFRMSITVALTPLALAFMPISPDWTKNAVNSFATAIIHVGTLAFLASISTGITHKIAVQMVGNYQC